MKFFPRIIHIASVAIVAVSSILCSFSAVAQIREVKNAPSPEVANLGTYGSIPVGHYTGTPDISVPLYTLNVGSLSVPIEARYHLSNVKPHTAPSNLGVGWSLCAGGYIARKVNGAQDERETYTTKAGFYYNHNKLNQIENSSNKSGKLKELTKLWGDNWYELAADEFTFNFNGYSGSFFMDKDGVWRVISDDNIKVEFDANTGFRSTSLLGGRINTRDYVLNLNKTYFDRFTLITPDGTCYEFGGENATEFCIPYYNQTDGNLVATCWRLSKITTIDKRVITFDYAADSFSCDIRYSPQYLVHCCSLDKNTKDIQQNTGRNGYNGYLLMPSRLVKINYEDETICFSYTKSGAYGQTFLNTDCYYWDSYNGIYPSSFRLYRDSRYNYQQLRESMYQKRFCSLMGIDPTRAESQITVRQEIADKISHHILSEMTVSKSNNLSLKIEFSYYNKNQKYLLSNVRYFAESLRTLFPELYQVLAELNRPEQTWDTENNALPTQRSSLEVIDGPNLQLNDIEQIYQYRFEYNFDPFTNGKQLWPTRKPLTYTDSWGYYRRINSNSPNTGEWELSQSYLKNDFITRDADLPSTKVFTLKNIIYPTGGKTEFEYELNDYSKVFDLQTGTVKNSSGTSGGLRVKSVTNLDVSGALINKKKYSYKTSDGTQSSGICHGLPQYNVCINFEDAGDRSHTDTIQFYSFEDLNPYPLNFNTPTVGYSTVVEELYDSNDVLQRSTLYEYTNYGIDRNFVTHNDESCVVKANVLGRYECAPFSSKAFERGKLVYKEVRDSNRDILEKEEYKYIRTEGNPYITCGHEWYINSHLSSVGMSFVYYTYANRYLISVVKRKESTSGASIENEIKNEYTNSGMLRSVKKIFATGNSETLSYKYTFDDNEYSWMARKNILVPVLTTNKYNQGSVQKKSIFKFVSGLDSIPYMSGIETKWLDNNNIQQRAKVEYEVVRTDRYGNPVEITENGLTTVLIWGNKGRTLMASIQDSSYEDVKRVAGKAPEDYSGDNMQYSTLNSLRSLLPKAMIYTYEYDIFYNLRSKTDYKGLKSFYKYDQIGRLVMEEQEVNGAIETKQRNYYKYVSGKLR